MAGLRLKPQNGNEMDKALEERKKKVALKEMETSATEAMNEADRQKEKHYAEMLACVQKKDYKRAERHAKMYMFMDKLSKVSKEYAEMLEDQRAMAATLESLEKMNKSFGAVFGTLGNTEDITSRTMRNMKKFGSYVSSFDSQMDRMMAGMDDIFSDGKKKGKRSKDAPAEEDDEASFLKYISGNSDLSARYQSAAEPAPAEPAFKAEAGGSYAPAPAGKSDGDDFISVGTPD
ncbi:MAG: hypothetical protein LUD51_03840 [Clostridia bacterium]|nr:hypothetical protein [Clostridia bacterium]